MHKIPDTAKDCCIETLESGDATCVFGCGSSVDPDHKMCFHCREHSANEIECVGCGIVWNDWSGDWACVDVEWAKRELEKAGVKLTKQFEEALAKFATGVLAEHHSVPPILKAAMDAVAEYRTTE